MKTRLASCALALALLAAPLAAEAQPAGKVYRIGYLETGVVRPLSRSKTPSTCLA
jgi:hypothetical protein